MGVLGAAAATGALAACAATTESAVAAANSGTVLFHGPHQAGILSPSPAQSHLVLAAFDVVVGDRQALSALLQQWTAVSAAMTMGVLTPGGTGESNAPPQDTGEAVGLAAARLTVTCGFGASLFDARFGLAARRPAALAPLPAQATDALDPAGGDGDISIQACADDLQVAFHAIHELARLGSGVVMLRWLRTGFMSTQGSATPRNLLGFKDGTRNLTAADGDLLSQYLWAGVGDPEWMSGGSYQVVRRMQLNLDRWDVTGLTTQQQVFGRTKSAGAPLSGGSEHATPNFTARAANGSLVISKTAHIRLMSHELNYGVRILRRGYSYADTIDPQSGALEAGLLFIAYVRRPEQFTTLASHLENDSLAQFVSTVASALFAIPGGVAQGQGWHTNLFG